MGRMDESYREVTASIEDDLYVKYLRRAIDMYTTSAMHQTDLQFKLIEEKIAETYKNCLESYTKIRDEGWLIEESLMDSDDLELIEEPNPGELKF